MASTSVPGAPGQFCIRGFSYILDLLNNNCLLSQFKSSEGCSEELSSPSSFTALMKAAYSQGMSTLLEDAFRKKVEETLPSMSMAEYPVAVKQILLYINSTLENVGTVSDYLLILLAIEAQFITSFQNTFNILYSSPKQ